MKPPVFARLLLPALLILASCAGMPSSDEPKPGSLTTAVPGQPVTLPGIDDPATPARPRTSSTDLRQRKARPQEVRRARPHLAQAFWLDHASTGAQRRVIISLSHQVAQVWEDDSLIAQSPVSTGSEGYQTPPGRYAIVDKRRQHYSSLYGEFIDASGRHLGPARAGQKPPPGARYAPSPMPYFLRMTWSGIGMHQGYLPGWPASHGCIRLPEAMARKFFEELPKGTPVEIIP